MDPAGKSVDNHCFFRILEKSEPSTTVLARQRTIPTTCCVDCFALASELYHSEKDVKLQNVQLLSQPEQTVVITTQYRSMQLCIYYF